ncbi:MAG: B12-binding domain-containing radical SAM protein [Myxococcota bacterium]|nr:B12-binding domain-containing radical SAM protein [Myxococcota bacterium]
MTASDNRRVVFAYIGDEQLSWSRQAFSRARHYYVLPGILYLKAVIETHRARLGISSVDCMYFNRAVHSSEAILAQLVEAAPKLLGFSCYSWNLAESLALARAVKDRIPGVRVVLGGPEVSFGKSEEAVAFLRANPDVDAIVLGEGEGSIQALAAAMLDDQLPHGIANVMCRDGDEIFEPIRCDAPVDLKTIPEIDPAGVDVARSPGTGLAIVYQTYRGCPHTCAYCSFHGGAKGIRRFPMDRVARELKTLFEARVALINFAESVFDISRDQAKRILRHCLEHNIQTSLLCYAAFQGMDDELADLLEQTRIQVGIGLQSVHDHILDAVHRKFSVARFFASIKALKHRKINYYVDLMFGLPGDSLEKFQVTFDQVMELHPPFVMPFPLTIIPRSEIASDLEGFDIKRYSDAELTAAVKPISGMVYADIGLYKDIALEDLRRFDNVATAIFFAFQRYPRTLWVLSHYAVETRGRGHGLSAFMIFETVGDRIRQRLDHRPIDVANPPLIEGSIREALVQILDQMDGSAIEKEALESLMHVETSMAYLLAHADRRQLYLRVQDRALENIALGPKDPLPQAAIVAFKVPCRPIRLPFLAEHLEGMAELKNRICKHKSWAILVAPYDDWQTHIIAVSELSLIICEEMQGIRTLPLRTLERRLRRTPNNEQWRKALHDLVEHDIVGIYRRSS